MYRRWSEDDIEYLRLVLTEPEKPTLAEVAEALGSTKAAVMQQMTFLRRSGCDGYLAKWSEDEVNFLRRSYKVISTQEIAYQLNKSCKAIRLKAMKEGLADKQVIVDDERIKELASQNITSREIARRMGIAPQTVCTHLKKLGIKCNKEIGLKNSKKYFGQLNELIFMKSKEKSKCSMKS